MRAIWTLLATWLSFWGFHPAKFHHITAPLPRIVALTFDDGPSPVYTPKILTILKDNNVHATFFVLGSEAERFPQVTREIIRQGSVIANHGYGHLNFFTRASNACGWMPKKPKISCKNQGFPRSLSIARLTATVARG